ncbi:ALF repeat-containing protein [Actinosynnema sp. NPDC051121]
MGWKIPAGILLALALFIPAPSAVAQTGSPGLNATTCQTVHLYANIRELVTIDLDTASDIEIRVLANQILSAARVDSLTILSDRLQTRLDGTPEDLRAFLKTGLQPGWSTDLRLAVNWTVTGAGPNVRAAAQKVLDNGTIDAFLAYLNGGLYVARALDSGSAVHLYRNIRELVTINLDTASDIEIRVLANQILSAAKVDSLTILSDRLQTRLDGTPEDLRAFLKTGLQPGWSTDLRLAVNWTVTGAGPNVRAAAQKVLDNGTIDAFLAYLNGGLYVARALDCA